MDKNQLMELLGRYHLRPDKSLGQHYLVDPTILAAIVEAAAIKPAELVVEVGAGPGILTRALASAGADVLAVEFDRRFSRLLNSEFHNWRNVHILSDDALRLDFATLERDGQPYRKMVANIPYQITNPLVRKILAVDSPLTTAILLIQAEVAERLMAPPGSSRRGILTVMVEARSTITKVIDVPPAAFWPPPKVNSTVIKLERLASDSNEEAIAPADEQAFFWLVKQGFSGKRKTLVNSLSGGLRLAKAAATAIVEEAKIAPVARAEDLTLVEWHRLFAVVKSGRATMEGLPPTDQI